MLEKPINHNKNITKAICYSLLFVFTLTIFVIAQIIEKTLISYDLNSMFVSFCAGFILFIPLLSLVLHPLAFNKDTTEIPFHFSAFVTNLGLVMVVQMLCFLIWMTDAVAIYSIYVDQTSFLAKAFNINAQNRADFSEHFYWANLFLAWFFAAISLVIGILPCLNARINNSGVVSNFVLAFSFAKTTKINIALYALLLSMSVVLPLLYAKYLFLVLFPVVLSIVFYQIVKEYHLFNSQRAGE